MESSFQLMCLRVFVSDDMMATRRCNEPGGTVAVAIVASRAPGR
jgi:hypothetical protein